MTPPQDPLRTARETLNDLFVSVRRWHETSDMDDDSEEVTGALADAWRAFTDYEGTVRAALRAAPAEEWPPELIEAAETWLAERQRSGSVFSLPARTAPAEPQPAVREPIRTAEYEDSGPFGHSHLWFCQCSDSSIPRHSCPAEPQPAVDVERQVRQDEPGDIYPNGYGCSQCDGTGFMPQTAIDRLRAEGFRVPWSDYPAGTAHLDPDSELGRAVAADQGKTALPTATEPADGPGERGAREFIESITVFRPVDAEIVNATLDELQESPLPGARYAYEVVKRRFAAALSKPASPAIAARDGGETA